MTQDSNRSAQVPWGERPALPPSPTGWIGALTVPALLGHVVVMLVTTAVLTVVNLLAGPRIWWSLAILVVWLALVLIHAIGVGSRTLLVEEDEAETPPPRQHHEPAGPPIPAWLVRPGRAAAPTVTIPESWKLDDDDEPGPAQPATTPTDAAPAEPVDGKVPWRAATDIAWLRKPPPPASGETERPATREASS